MNDIECKGFMAGGLSAGIKKNGKPDLGLILSIVPASVAGVFTRNRVKAAPVQVCRQRIASGVCRAVVANSGCANCCTGSQGMDDALAMANEVAKVFDLPEEQVLVASTGVIGQLLPIQRILAGITSLNTKVEPGGFLDFARAVMTTDTEPKLVWKSMAAGEKKVNVIGVAKGAGMLCPDMATMLCFVCTDLAVPPDMLKDIFVETVDQTLNSITVDGDTSTNDTALILANGASGVSIQDEGIRGEFEKTLGRIMAELARWLVRDGEGVTKVAEITVKNADTPESARKIAYTVANSPLVKTAFFGEDANWGRILAAVGRADVAVDPDRIDIYFDNVKMVENGSGCGSRVETEATAVLRRSDFQVTIDLKAGVAEKTVITSDLSVEYIKINADYRS